MIHLEFAILYATVGYLYWSVYKLSKAVYKLDSVAAEEISRLKRALNPDQKQAYSAMKCQSCGNPLPAGTVRTHTGKWLCSKCKVK